MAVLTRNLNKHLKRVPMRCLHCKEQFVLAKQNTAFKIPEGDERVIVCNVCAAARYNSAAFITHGPAGINHEPIERFVARINQGQVWFERA